MEELLGKNLIDYNINNNNNDINNDNDVIDFNSFDKENKEVSPSHINEYVTDIKEEYFTENTPIIPKYNVTK